MSAKAQVLDGFWLKVIGIITMTFDHIGMFLIFYNASNSVPYTVGFVFRIIGRLAFPIFAFLLAEGMRHTSNRGRYILRLFYVWAAIFLFDLVCYITFKTGADNVIASIGAGVSAQAFTDLLCFSLFIYLLEHPNKRLRWLCALPLIYILISYGAGIAYNFEASNGALALTMATYFPEFIRADYSLYGFLMFLGFYYSYSIADAFMKGGAEKIGTTLEEYQKTPDYRTLVNIIGVGIFVIVAVIFWLIGLFDLRLDPYQTKDMTIQNYCLIDAFILMLYNGKRGYDRKWLRWSEYLYYPVHIAVIALIFSLIYG
jgi:hypothetical protein